MNIAILEDDRRDLEHLRLTLESCTKKNNLPAKVEAFSAAEQFLRAFAPGKYDLIFFDNYIGNGLGVDVARKVRSMDAQAGIVFVSMSAEFAISGFEVGALHYLIKPVTFDELQKVFERLDRQQRPDPPKAEAMLEVVTEHESTRLPVGSILYIEVTGKACHIHHEGGVTKTHTSLEKLAEQLPEPLFQRTHKSYIVNIARIKAMDKDAFQMANGDPVPIGRTHVTSCKRAYMKYLAEK